MKTRSGHLFKRGKTWYVQWRVNGKLFMRSTKRTRKSDAEKARARIMAPFLAEDEAMVLEHVAARIGGRKAEIAAYEESQNPPLTIDKAWTAYLKSPNRRDCGDRTLADYAGYFKRFKKWMTAEHTDAATLRDVALVRRGPYPGTDPAHTQQVTGEVTREVAEEVTGEVEEILARMRGEMTRQQPQEALGLRAEDSFRKRYLVPALGAGLIEMTIPDKPQGRFQKYRLTDKGRALLRKA